VNWRYGVMGALNLEGVRATDRNRLSPPIIVEREVS